ncbi:hypothetical protein NPIL_374581 [Nephila pilipes]|uniref:Uncharacterized protein n=1 Tax=Nephila pilipes TaxID=299642 RepID=A0A8X6N3S0_NEPPI|nr:hypothetical protein NPIL_374581 [Nephila pilipes]
MTREEKASGYERRKEKCDRLRFCDVHKQNVRKNSVEDIHYSIRKTSLNSNHMWFIPMVSISCEHGFKDPHLPTTESFE